MTEQMTGRTMWAALPQRWHDRIELLAAGQAVDYSAGLQAEIVWPAPAAESSITALQARLGVTLPPSYLEFLRLSDGWPAVTGSPVGLASSGHVHWARVPDTGHAVNPLLPGGAGDVATADLIRHALNISTPDGETLLLDPTRVDPVTGEWRCVHVIVDPETPLNPVTIVGDWVSFRDALHSIYDRMPADPGPMSVAERVEDAYQRSLAGDLSAGTVFHALAWDDWRAYALQVQFDAFTADNSGKEDWSDTPTNLWCDMIAGMTSDAALADPVILDELAPLLVVPPRVGTPISAPSGPDRPALRQGLPPTHHRRATAHQPGSPGQPEREPHLDPHPTRRTRRYQFTQPGVDEPRRAPTTSPQLTRKTHRLDPPRTPIHPVEIGRSNQS